jgi:hypothetical protein
MIGKFQCCERQTFPYFAFLSDQPLLTFLLYVYLDFSFLGSQVHGSEVRNSTFYDVDSVEAIVPGYRHRNLYNLIGQN